MDGVRVGAFVFAAAFLLTGFGMVAGAVGAETTAGHVVCAILAVVFLPIGLGALRFARNPNLFAEARAQIAKQREAVGAATRERSSRLEADSELEATVLMLGQEGEATVIRADGTKPGQPARFELNVQPAGDGDPYTCTIVHNTPATLAALPAPGASLAVRIDPDNREVVAIDWGRTSFR